MKAAYGSQNSNCAATASSALARGPPVAPSAPRWRKTALAVAGTVLCVSAALVMYHGAISVSDMGETDSEVTTVTPLTVMKLEGQAVTTASDYAVPDMMLAGQEILLGVSARTNMCMDDGGGTSAGKTRFSIKTCNPHSPSQVFIYDAQTYQFHSESKSNLCVDDGGGEWAGESAFRLWDCDPNSRSQRFVMEPTTRMLRNPIKDGGDLCVTEEGKAAGKTHVFLGYCDENFPSLQQFDVLSLAQMEAMSHEKMEALGTGATFAIRIADKSNLCADDGEGQTTAPSQFLAESCDLSNKNQIFKYDASIQRVRSALKEGLCLDDGGGSSAGETTFVLGHCDANNPDQAFEYDLATMLIHQANKPNLCIDDGGARETNAGPSRFTLENCNASSRNQHFELVLAPQPIAFEDPTGLSDSMPLDAHAVSSTGVELGEEPSVVEPSSTDQMVEDFMPEEIMPDEATSNGFMVGDPMPVEENFGADESVPGFDEAGVLSELENPDMKLEPNADHSLASAHQDSEFKTSVMDELSFSGDWNLLAPSEDTVVSVNADDSADISADEIFTYLQSVKDHTEMEYALMEYRYQRTRQCVSAGLEMLTKDTVTPDEYHVLVRWMFEHCAAGNHDVVPPPDISALPPSVLNDTVVAPLLNDTEGALDNEYMSKNDFFYEIKNHFVQEHEQLTGSAAAAHLRSEQMAELKKKLKECIQEASEKFAYDDPVAADPMDNIQLATTWVRDECMQPHLADLGY